MDSIVIAIHPSEFPKVKSLLEKNGISYYTPGHPNGKITIITSYPSKMNEATEIERGVALKIKKDEHLPL